MEAPVKAVVLDSHVLAEMFPEADLKPSLRISFSQFKQKNDGSIYSCFKDHLDIFNFFLRLICYIC
jgi:hypothetical protein